MNRRRMAAVMSLAASATLILAGCATNAPGANDMDLSPYLDTTFSSTEAGEPYVEFGENGRFTGSDGCNGFGGEYEVDGDVLVLNPGFTTLKACEGVDGWLQHAKTVALDGDTLRVYDAAGDELGTLSR